MSACCRQKGLFLLLKRPFDLIVSSLALLLLSPLFVVTAVIIWLTDGRPILYSQQRLGQQGKLITIHKFRSMTHNPHRTVNAQVRLHDPEVTGFGRFIRRTKIDELPQIWNVWVGNMSVVGPRPALPASLETYDARQSRRLEVKGGLTCLAQIYGSSHLPWDERIEYDLEYIARQSFWLDLQIIFKTVIVVVLGEERFIKHPPMNHYFPLP